MDENEVTEASVVADLAREAMPPQLIESEDGRQFLVTHESMRVQDVTDPHDLFVHKPSYAKQTVILQTTASLVDYIDRYKLPQTSIFADIEKDRMEAIIDYHGPSQADHKAHRAHFVLKRSEEWKAWTSFADRMIGQLEFVRFLEENAIDVTVPDAGTLMDITRDIHGLRKVRFEKAVRASSNNENFEYTVDNEAKTKGGVELPTNFEIRIPVYFDEPPVIIKAFLRWQIDPEEGGLKLGIKLHRPEYVRQEEFQRIVSDVGFKVERPVVYGNVVEATR